MCWKVHSEKCHIIKNPLWLLFSKSYFWKYWPKFSAKNDPPENVSVKNCVKVLEKKEANIHFLGFFFYKFKLQFCNNCITFLNLVFCLYLICWNHLHSRSQIQIFYVQFLYSPWIYRKWSQILKLGLLSSYIFIYLVNRY